MIKVLMIITGGLRRNGICVSQLDYAKYINKNEVKLDFIAAHNDAVDMIEEYQRIGCTVHKLPDRRKHILKYIKKLRELIAKEKYDIVNVLGSSSLMLIELMTAKKCKVKVRIANSRNTKCDRPILEKFIRPFFNSSYNYALACGTEAGEWMFGKKDFTVFHNGKDLDKYKFNKGKRKEFRAKLNLDDDEIAYGNVGTFYEQKNHLFLIDIFNKINKNNPKTKLFLMGEGKLEGKIKEKVNEYELQNKVVFMGRIPNVNEVLNAMDCMLFPSLFEGLPNVVLEWQANGLISLVSNKVTTECRVAEFTKYLPIDNGTNEWSREASSIKILNDEDRQKESEKGCKGLIENGFEIKSNTLKLEEYYRNCLRKEMKL